MKYLVLTLGLALGACTTTTSIDPQPAPHAPPITLQAVEYGCASAGAALEAINLNFARLSAGARQRVAQAKSVTDPICLQTTVPTLSSTAKAGFDAAVLALTGAQAEVQ